MLAIALAAALCAVLHVSSFAVAGHAAGVTVREVGLGWGPVLARIGGAAQRLLAGGSAFAQAQPFALTLGLVAAKLAACNLLPLPALNGGQALALLFGRFVQAPAARVKGLLQCTLALMASWTVALGWYALQALHRA